MIRMPVGRPKISKKVRAYTTFLYQDQIDDFKRIALNKRISASELMRNIINKLICDESVKNMPIPSKSELADKKLTFEEMVALECPEHLEEARQMMKSGG